MTAGIYELAFAITLACGLSFLARLLKQPLVIAYLATGTIITQFNLFDLNANETFHVFADLGIMFLLFLVGLEINYKSLKLVGKTSLTLGVGQVLFTSLVGFLIARVLGFAALPAAYIAVALTFSSTIIIVKLLSDKKDLNSLYGKISIGMMLTQDVIAVLILLGLSSLQTSAFSWDAIYIALVKGLGLFGITIWLGKNLLPKIFDRIAHSQELLFLASTAWVLMIAVVVDKLGFSIEIAGFLAGLALANSLENFQIANKIRPLRDFFILIFFLILGASFVFSDFSGLVLPVAIFSVFVLVGNPIIVLTIMGLLGHKKRTGFLTGVTVAQISEFSLILAALGLKLGHITENVLALITGVGVITITLSTYLIINAGKIYKLIAEVLTVFERKKVTETPVPDEQIRKKIVLIGFHRTGRSIAHHLPAEDILIVDFDPDIIRELSRRNSSYIFGDISDPDVLDRTVSPQTEIVISTSPDLDDNLILISKLRERKKRPKIIVRSETESEAKILYRQGADYVVVPSLSSGYHLGLALMQDPTSKILASLRKKDQVLLKKSG